MLRRTLGSPQDASDHMPLLMRAARCPGSQPRFDRSHIPIRCRSLCRERQPSLQLRTLLIYFNGSHANNVSCTCKAKACGKVTCTCGDDVAGSLFLRSRVLLDVKRCRSMPLSDLPRGRVVWPVLRDGSCQFHALLHSLQELEINGALHDDAPPVPATSSILRSRLVDAVVQRSAYLVAHGI